MTYESKLANATYLGWAWIASGVFWILQLIFVTTFYIVGQPFGALSDFSNAMTTLVMLPSVFMLYKVSKDRAPVLNPLALIAGLLGILSNSIASFLILLGLISFAQSLPPILVGYAAYGAWLTLSFWLLRRSEPASSRLIMWGFIIGIGLASIGLLASSINAELFEGRGFATLISNPMIYPVLILFPIGYFGYPVWVIRAGRDMLAGKYLFGPLIEKQ